MVSTLVDMNHEVIRIVVNLLLKSVVVFPYLDHLASLTLPHDRRNALPPDDVSNLVDTFYSVPTTGEQIRIVENQLKDKQERQVKLLAHAKFSKIMIELSKTLQS